MIKIKKNLVVCALMSAVFLQACTSDDDSGGTSTTTIATGVGLSISEAQGINETSTTIFTKDFSIAVVDDNGAGVEGIVINLTVSPDFFVKGAFVDDGAGAYINETSGSRSRIFCTAETTDDNGNGNIDPTGVVSIAGGNNTLVTDASGRANFSLEYGREFSTWVGVIIRAVATVGSTTLTVDRDYQLAQLASVFTDSSISFAGDTSPFGPNIYDDSLIAPLDPSLGTVEPPTTCADLD